MYNVAHLSRLPFVFLLVDGGCLFPTLHMNPFLCNLKVQGNSVILFSY